MTQFQWIFSIIPDAILNWVYWGIIAVGITGMFAGWFGKFIPVYGRYIEYIKPVGIVLVVLGVWLRGGYDTEMVWRAKVAEAEAKVAKAEEISKDANNVFLIRCSYFNPADFNICSKKILLSPKAPNLE